MRDAKHTSPFTGRRHDVAPWDESIQPGDYGKWPVDGTDSEWWVCDPLDTWPSGGYISHQVTEHENGTITVSPSILCKVGDIETFHGWLNRGVWTW
jgi:hypothetical protein